MKQNSFRKDIEGLRAVAVLLVVLYHAGFPGLSGGYVGVDVFFVISGFLISGLLIREWETTGRIDFVQFYARRTRRLLPAAVFVLLVTLFATRLWYSPIEQAMVAKTGLASSLYSTNFLFIRRATDYLGAAPETDPLLHMWSLAVEEQFYFFWPLLVMLGLRFQRDHDGRSGLFAGMCGVAALSLGASVWLTEIRQPLAFFGLPTRAWEFAAGGLTCMGTRYLPPQWLRRRMFLPWLGLVTILASAVLYTATAPFPGIVAIVPVLGTVAILLLDPAVAGNALRPVLENRVMQTIGKLSYSWYLWHWPVLVFGNALQPEWGLPGRLAAMLFALGLAALTVVAIENPIRFYRPLSGRPGFSLGLAAVATIASVAFCGLLFRAARVSEKEPGQMVFTNALQDLPIVYVKNCHLDPADTGMRPCVFGDTEAKEDIVLFGDSHAAQWFSAVDTVAKNHHWRLHSFTKSACPVPAVELYSPQLGRQYTECTQWREEMIQAIVAMRPTSVIVSSWGGYVRVSGSKSGGTVSPEAWKTGWQITLNRFRKAGIPVVMLKDSPQPGFDVLACLSRAAWTGRQQSCSFDLPRAESDLVAGIESRVAHASAGAFWVDMGSYICPGRRCDPVQNESIVYRDKDHLTARYAATLARYLESPLSAHTARRSAHQ